jgi:hypothetical protein
MFNEAVADCSSRTRMFNEAVAKRKGVSRFFSARTSFDKDRSVFKAFFGQKDV